LAIDHLRGDQRAVELIERLAVEGEQLLASELTRFELLDGMRPVEFELIGLFMSALIWSQSTKPLPGWPVRWPLSTERRKGH
jgi:hypothetical protein